MITKKHLKIFLSFLSLVVLLLGGCKVRNKLGSVTQDSQISGVENSGEIVSNGLSTSLPIWNVKHFPIPEEYWGIYQYLEVVFDYQRIRIATVTERDITFSYKEDDGSFHAWAYFHVFDKKAEYQGNNTWSWHPSYRGDNYINKYKNDFRISPAIPEIMTFKRNEKGQRVLWYNESGSYVHEDDMNK